MRRIHARPAQAACGFVGGEPMAKAIIIHVYLVLSNQVLLHRRQVWASLEGTLKKVQPLKIIGFELGQWIVEAHHWTRPVGILG